MSTWTSSRCRWSCCAGRSCAAGRSSWAVTATRPGPTGGDLRVLRGPSARRAGRPTDARRRAEGPDAVFLPLDAGRLRGRLGAGDGPPCGGTGRPLEVWGWDEASSAPGADDPEPVAAGSSRSCGTATGLPCSIGIGDNKLRAKAATGFGKPAGMYRLTSENWMPVMGDRPVRALWGVGAPAAPPGSPSTASGTVADLASADPAELAAVVGSDDRPALPGAGPRRGGDDDPHGAVDRPVPQPPDHLPRRPDRPGRDRAGAAGTGRPGGRQDVAAEDQSITEGGGDRPELVVLHRESRYAVSERGRRYSCGGHSRDQGGEHSDRRPCGRTWRRLGRRRERC